MPKDLFSIGALLILLLLAPCPVTALDKPIPLESIAVLPINGPPNNQPSGLLLYRGKLLTVSDKHDDTLFELKIDQDTAHQVPFLKFDPQELKKKKRLDFEGLTVDAENRIYLISENYFRVAVLSDKGRTIQWATPSFKKWGRKRGLFQTKGAYFEGITLIGNRLLMCVERQPRGLIEYHLKSGARRAFNTDATQLKTPPGRTPDFTGLTYFGGALYVLQRGAHLISEIDFENGVWVEKRSGSFSHIENDPLYHYQTMHYGRAEGLAMDGNKIYVVLDNNNDFRVNDPTDNRPLLLILKNRFPRK